MRATYTVEYQDQRSETPVSISLTGPLLLVPRSLSIKEKQANRIVLIPRDTATTQDRRIGESEAPDVLVGSIPLIHLDNNGIHPVLTYLDIPPPSPFHVRDIEAMWQKIRLSGCPIPRSVTLQGQYAPGRAHTIHINQITVDYLDYAHQQCRQLLSRWPTIETQEVVLRNIELRGGREDFLMTERRLGSLPILMTQKGRHIPQRTFRRRAKDASWHSQLLREAASAVHDTVRSRINEQLTLTEVDKIVAPFASVARLATPSLTLVDPPLSTWPLNARRCYESLLATMAALKVEDNGKIPAPLCHLWRLYEAWIAVLCLEAVIHFLGFLPPDDSSRFVKGCEWITQWRLHNGCAVVLLAQPHISKNGLGSSLQSIVPIKSITSDLVPDVLLAITSDYEIQLLIVDAKKRSQLTSMDPREVAETASKYLWGIRSLEQSEIFPVRSTIIASTMQPGKMHSTHSCIQSLCVTPANSYEFSNAISQELDNATTGLLR
jgi:hypothetical protein